MDFDLDRIRKRTKADMKLNSNEELLCTIITQAIEDLFNLRKSKDPEEIRAFVSAYKWLFGDEEILREYDNTEDEDQPQEINLSLKSILETLNPEESDIEEFRACLREQMEHEWGYQITEEDLPQLAAEEESSEMEEQFGQEGEVNMAPSKKGTAKKTTSESDIRVSISQALIEKTMRQDLEWKRDVREESLEKTVVEWVSCYHAEPESKRDGEARDYIFTVRGLTHNTDFFKQKEKEEEAKRPLEATTLGDALPELTEEINPSSELQKAKKRASVPRNVYTLEIFLDLGEKKVSVPIQRGVGELFNFLNKSGKCTKEDSLLSLVLKDLTRGKPNDSSSKLGCLS